MRRKLIFGIFFFGGLWGVSEAVLGGTLYGANVEHASVILTVIGLIVLTFANVNYKRVGMATAIAGCAMLYKFLNEPFFACHLLAIFLIGLCYDLTVNVLRIKNRATSAIATVYLSYALFSLMITYVFRYGYWMQGGLDKVVTYIGIDGSLAALVSVIVVPVSSSIAEWLKQKSAAPLDILWRFVTGSVPILTVGLWVFGVGAYLFS